jgi:hypothetical protein
MVKWSCLKPPSHDRRKTPVNGWNILGAILTVPFPGFAKPLFLDCNRRFVCTLYTKYTHAVLGRHKAFFHGPSIVCFLHYCHHHVIILKEGHCPVIQTLPWMKPELLSAKKLMPIELCINAKNHSVFQKMNTTSYNHGDYPSYSIILPWCITAVLAVVSKVITGDPMVGSSRAQPCTAGFRDPRPEGWTHSQRMLS